MIGHDDGTSYTLAPTDVDELCVRWMRISADLSAFAGCSAIPLNLVKFISPANLLLDKRE